ncbi:response regulator transcription factor [Quadrisphaera setariae]|uniref:Response regulator transcription factor n=1 Tax=Quadrisphaera setariae TaxID=2593304 RepID=A0A5C8ZL09_9ACTN|nr:response regulator transcription factor [Quadrisphaera setariae]TXR57843.1 response regulator transcription factor [Quadrisphaera setariae]
MATVMVCDDSPLVRENLRRAVAGVAGVGRVVGASSGEEVLARWPVERPALVLMDVRMPGIGGVEAARRLLARHPGAGVLMLTVAEDVEGVARAVAAGARGYVVKDATRSELVAAVIGAMSDAGVRGRGSRRTEEGAAPSLTERELQVLTGMGEGRSNAEIGKQLFLSEDTVKTHARRLFRKLDAADRAQAVAKGFRLGMVH